MGRAVFGTVWNPMENMMTLKDLTPPDGPIGMKPIFVENFDVIKEF